MERRFILFLVLSFAILMVNLWIMRALAPPQPKKGDADKQQVAEKAEGDKKKQGEEGKAAPAVEGVAGDEKKADEAAPGEEGAKEGEVAAAQPAIADEEKVAPEWVTLGSAAEDSPHGFLISFTNVGAAVGTIELNRPRYLDTEDRTGYIGFLAPKVVPQGSGCLVGVVGAGTPAAVAGIEAGDVITELAGEQIADPIDLERVLKTTENGKEVSISVTRGGQNKTLSIVPRRRPMAILRPEGGDPLSFLLTMAKIDGDVLADDATELPGLKMRTAAWKIAERDENHVSFTYRTAETGLLVTKTFRLVELAGDAAADDARRFTLAVDVKIENLGGAAREVAYRFDGPTGLPIEGAWYAYKISPNWRGGAGMRDFVAGIVQPSGYSKSVLVSTYTIASGNMSTATIPWRDVEMSYLGVDAQYFACVLLPQGTTEEKTLASVTPIIVGPEQPEKLINRTNISSRLTSQTFRLASAGDPNATVERTYDIFAGPKVPDILTQYGLDKLVEYGMFGWVSRPMLRILHFFYSIIPNYGIAIVLLTVLVRSAMFPLSRRQVANAAKMQELQPELKRLAEKYKGKNQLEQRAKAQQELFRKHNYHPLSGCLPLLVQFPIFLGLYRSLTVDVELRQAPLISESVRWASNLAAPDMLFYWGDWGPAFLTGETGWLGPYFNLLPCITIALFLMQQKMFMPPATDEQTELTQKMMRIMMIVMGVVFFKVAAGLCVYLIVSSVWGLAERKLLPKTTPVGGDVGAPAAGAGDTRAVTSQSGNGAAQRKRKQRDRR